MSEEETEEEDVLDLEESQSKDSGATAKSGFCSNHSCYNQKTTRRKFKNQMSYFCDVKNIIFFCCMNFWEFVKFF